MNHLATLLIGPLAGPECRRALARGWVILVRCLAAVAVACVALVVLWWWWVVGQSEPGHQPYYELRVGLMFVEAMLLTIALVQGPAVLAGSLAGEKQRGVLSLLLSTRVSTREIVTGRLVGKLSQVGMILLGGVPPLVLLASLAGLRPSALLLMLLVPAAIGFGGGGMAALASTVSKRGRDALLAVYLFDVLMLLGPLARRLSLPPVVTDGFAAVSPYTCLVPLVWEEDVSLALATVAIWATIGAAGIAAAAWRLRPSCLGPADSSGGARRAARRGWVPPVDEKRPMLWKELFIERVASLGRFGRWAGLALTVALAAGSVTLTLLTVLAPIHLGGPEWADWARWELGAWVGGSAMILSFLIQWAVGLRASVSISSERERGTWDALLTSPLSAGEIVRGKLWGSLYALRWLVGATFLAWTLAAATEAWSVNDAVAGALEVLFAGAFLAAVGVRTSLVCNTATRAMAITIGVWLGSYVAVALIAALALATAVMLANAGWIVLTQLGVVPMMTGFWTPSSFFVWPLTNDAIYLIITAIIVADTRLRFDRIAGRMTEGKAALAFEEALYGRTEMPVLLEDVKELVPAEDSLAGEFERDRVAGPA